MCPARQLSSLVASTSSCSIGMLSACLGEPNQVVLLNRILELLLPLGVKLDHGGCNAVLVQEVSASITPTGVLVQEPLP